MSLLERYPEATLQDIYKGSFQDYFGAAHALSNREGVKRYILSELEPVAEDATPSTEPCGWRGQYVRVDLAWLKSGRVDIDDFVNAFMASAESVDEQRIDAWRREWGVIESVVRRVAPDIKDFERDSAALRQMLSEGHYVVHHSEEFNAAYSPHYRIIRKDKIDMIFP